ncbi:hypothetical protein VSAK1_09308 [Vibrio mediterranei AK1]|uniref:outer membrane beta-barrel protein n=1 Tax=Vibrio mediterranei TaxID=689 RepID=UPI0001542BCF|nr:outer membrane beta-barrel protein [Vibrio mediterranei]EDL51555.1 hypothetical protein VSAK1_09308 [Vibrio mediterranei AK1]
MKSRLLAFSALLLVQNAIADDYTGLRIGAGSTSGYSVATDVVTLDGSSPQAETFHTDLGNNLKVEMGYDFNRVFAVNASYTNINGNGTHYGLSGGNSSYQLSNDFTSHKFMLEAELGYAFAVENFDIKPYVALGLAYQSLSDYARIDSSLDNSDIYTSDGDRQNKTGATAAIGVRVNTPLGIYIDGRAGQSNMFNKMDENTTTVTVGYKF